MGHHAGCFQAIGDHTYTQVYWSAGVSPHQTDHEHSSLGQSVGLCLHCTLHPNPHLCRVVSHYPTNQQQGSPGYDAIKLNSYTMTSKLKSTCMSSIPPLFDKNIIVRTCIQSPSLLSPSLSLSHPFTPPPPSPSLLHTVYKHGSITKITLSLNQRATHWVLHGVCTPISSEWLCMFPTSYYSVPCL